MPSSPAHIPSRRHSQIYVDVPIRGPSSSSAPPTAAKPSQLHVSPHPSRILKENTPLHPQFSPSMIHHNSASTNLKRKLDQDAHAPSAKKQKHASTSAPVMNGTPLKLKPTKGSTSAASQLVPMENASEEYPHGFIYCHQCCKKRDVRDSLHCTYLCRYTTSKDKRMREKRCINKFCRACLKNRYNEDLDQLCSSSNGKRKDNDHVEGVGYIFTCPRCRDICNCPKCRKLKGLEPIGSLTIKKVAEQASTKSKSAKGKSAAASKPKAKPKPLPILNWTSLSSSLTLEEAEDRFVIREFILRFAPIMDPPPNKAVLEELENVAGRKKNRDEEREMEDWVGEACVKSVIMGLLGLVADAAQKSVEEHVEVALKELKSAGVNLSRIWSILANLREAVADYTSLAGTSSTSPNSDFYLTFPDPLPPPAVTITYNTRHKQNGQDGVLHVTHSAQLIPIITSLIELVTDTEVIRNEIERGVREGKDAVRDAREGVKMENDRWELIRKTLVDASKDRTLAPINKVKRETHKLQLLNFENALKVIMPSFAPRFEPLGRDTEGRVYYALTPGAGEREAALEFLVNSLLDNKQKTKSKKRDRVLSPEERSEMKEWSWFIAVWGSKPEEARVNGYVNGNGGEEDNEAEEDDDDERWWGFWEPEEIRKVAEWIRIKGGLYDADADDTKTKASSNTNRKSYKQTPSSVMVVPDMPSEEQLRGLVKGLEEYAGSLEWRIREEKYGTLELAKAQAVAAEKAEVQAKRKSTGGSASTNGR